MSKILAVTILHLKKQIKDRAFLVMLLLPLLFTFIFGMAFAGGGVPQIPVGLADLDDTKISGEIVDFLQKDASLKITLGTAEEIRDSIKSRKLEAAVIIPAGFENLLKQNRPVTLETLSLPQNQNAAAVRQVLAGIAARVDADAAAAEMTSTQVIERGLAAPDQAGILWDEAYQKAVEQWNPRPPMEVSFHENTDAVDETGAGGSFSTLTHFSLGFSIAFVMFTLTFGAGVILEEREMGTWGRLLSTPVRPAQLMTGILAATFIAGWLQVAILILAGKFLFHVNWGSNLPATVILMSAYLFAVTGLGLMLSGFVRTHAQLQAVTPIVMTSFAMLGGAYWPLDIVPKAMQVAARFIPTGQVMLGLTDVVARGRGLADIQLPIFWLIVMGFLFLTVGIWRVRYD